MIALSPPLLLAVANALVGLGEDKTPERPGSRGKLVDCFLREVTGVEGSAEVFPFAPEASGVAQPVTRDASSRSPWDAAFVHHVGFWSHYESQQERSWWPLPIVTDLRVLATFAIERCILRHAPVAGDVFLLHSPSTGEFVRAGIIAKVKERQELEDGTDAYEVDTIEGDSDENLRLGGGIIMRHWRRLSAYRGDRFLRWTRLEPRVQRVDHIEAAVEAQAVRRSA